MSIAIKILVTSVATTLWALAPELAVTPASDPPSRVSQEELQRAKEILEQAAVEALVQADNAATDGANTRNQAEWQRQVVEAMALLVNSQGVEQQVRQEAASRAYVEALAQYGVARNSQVLEIEQELDRHRDRNHELRDRALRLREVIAELESRKPLGGLGPDLDERKRVQAEAEQLRHVELELKKVEIEAERSEMSLRRLEEVRERRLERSNIESMMDRIDYVANWKDIAFESDLAVSMAVQGIVEMQFGAGESGQAIEILSDLLERVDQVGARTALRFAIKDVAASKGEVHRATEQLRMIVLENAGGDRSSRR